MGELCRSESHCSWVAAQSPWAQRAAMHQRNRILARGGFGEHNTWLFFPFPLSSNLTTCQFVNDTIFFYHPPPLQKEDSFTIICSQQRWQGKLYTSIKVFKIRTPDKLSISEKNLSEPMHNHHIQWAWSLFHFSSSSHFLNVSQHTQTILNPKEVSFMKQLQVKFLMIQIVARVCIKSIM